MLMEFNQLTVTETILAFLFDFKFFPCPNIDLVGVTFDKS